MWPMSFAIAHRGASQLAPENTLSALKKAKQNGAKWVECDIQLTKDNQLIIFHDATLGRTTNGHGLLATASFSRIQKLDAGSWFSPAFKNERVPTLQQWLQCAATLDVGLNLEIKSRTKKESIALAAGVVDHLQMYWPAHSEKIVISSSNLFVLMQVAERVKSVPLGLISEKKHTEKELLNLVQSNIASLHQPFSLFDDAYVAQLHHVGLRALAYTVNDAACASALKKMHMDGIFTDNVALY